MQIQTGLTIATEMAATGRAAWLSGRCDFLDRTTIVQSVHCHLSHQYCDERDVLRYVAATCVIRHGIGIHANQLGESAYGESGSLKLDEKLSVRHQRSPPPIF